jgi:hypothetical protein
MTVAAQSSHPNGQLATIGPTAFFEMSETRHRLADCYDSTLHFSRAPLKS